ncbi:MAG: peptidase M29, partial [Burkholderiales bacterium]|nr:peptidase M29 [Burkholderiales bacterium]
MSEMRVEAHWIDVFVEAFRLCGVQPGDACAVLSETQSRAVLVRLSELALARLGARWFHVVVPTPRQTAPVPVRSTGASNAIGELAPVVQSLAASVFIADCTVEGLQHAVELPAILKGGARVLAISNEHPEILERTLPRAEDEAPVRDAMRRLRAAERMQVSSAAGTDLTVDLAGARVGGVWGFTAKPGSLSHWPGGLVLAFPAAGTVSGTLVLDRGDVNLAFKRYLADPVRLTIEDDHVARIDGDSVDAELMRGYFAAWGDREAYAVSHLGWGLNRRARWD